jgi:hypothetical protein
LGRHDGKFEETSNLNHSRYTDQRQLRCFLSPRFCAPGQSRDNAATWAFGGVGFISNSTDTNDQLKAVLTWSHGNNEIKGGASYDKIEYTDRQDYTGANVPVKFGVDIDGGGTATATALATPCVGGGGDTTDCYVLLDTRGGVLATLRQTAAGALRFRTTRGRYNPNPGPTETNDFALFVQDTWTFTPKWTLKAGLRANRQEIKGEGNYTLIPYLDDGLRTDASDLRTIPSGEAGEYKFDWAIAPRVGVTWDMKGDGRSKAYVNVARYFERVPNDLAIRALSNEAGFGTVNYTNWDLVTGSPDYQSALNLGTIRGGQTRVEDGTKLPYVDEFVVGWQQELGRDVSYEIRGIYREQGRSLEDTQFNSVEATENYYANYYFGYLLGATLDTVPFPSDPQGAAGAPFGEYVLANPGENTPAGFPKAVRKYYALEGILNKRFGDHWLFYGNVRFSRLRGNYEGLFRNDNGQSDPNISSLFDFPNSPILEGQFQNGVLNTDRPYSMKLYGSYQFDNGVNIGSASTWRPETRGRRSWRTRTASTRTREKFRARIRSTTGTRRPKLRPAAGRTCASQPVARMTSSVMPARRARSSPLGRSRTSSTTRRSGAVPTGGRRRKSRSTSTRVGSTSSIVGRRSRSARRVFNVLNSRETTLFDDNVELQAGVTDPDYLKPLAFQNPRSVRLFARWSF